nr:tetratricopeptide repeat protein [Euryarchaeota archaeon]
MTGGGSIGKTVLFTLVIFILATLLMPFVSAAPTIVGAGTFDPSLLAPLAIAIMVGLMLWRWLLPLSLSNLQVAFEVDDGLYEVPRLSKNKKEVMNLLNAPKVMVGSLAYLLAMTGILLIVCELLIEPSTFYEPVIYMMLILVSYPIIISPFVTLYAQLSRQTGDTGKLSTWSQMYGSFATIAMVLTATGIVLFVGYQKSSFGTDDEIFGRWIGFSLLAFMAPTILAYGRIMGASWNTLTINKWRTMRGQRTAIDPDKPGLFKRFASLLIVIFLATMPLTAINGIVTLVYVELENPADANSMLDLGGIIGWEIYQYVENNPVLQKVISLKALEITLASYLMLNVAIVGLAFIFELTRNLFLGGQTFGGIGGVILARPREIRSEVGVQGRVLFFGLAGFSGYSILLIILQTYKEFSHLMPYGDSTPLLSEEILLAETWQFIAAGQAIFLLTWILSLGRFSIMKNLRFDLNPDERREGAILAGGGDWMRNYVEEAAYRDDLDALRRFQSDTIKGNQLVVQLEKSRARMLECAIRGLWPEAIDVARKLLAQQGGEDDEARMIIAAGHIASRRLDAAREALRGLEQPEGYDEPEILSLVAEWFDPWAGSVTNDDFYDWEDSSAIHYLQELQKRLVRWDPTTSIDTIYKDPISLQAMISSVAKLRAERRHDEALELSLEAIRRNPNSAKARIAAALCLIDSGDWFDALDIFEELQISSPEDPRVKALGMILGFAAPANELESAIIEPNPKGKRRWIDEAPTNPIAALLAKNGEDEAINANIFIASHEAIERKMAPRYTPSMILRLFNWIVLLPTWIIIGLIAYDRSSNDVLGVSISASLIVLHFFALRFRKLQRRVIKHRDQKAMIAYAKRLKRYKISFDSDKIPVGTHLLLSGLLVTINGVVYDLGMPGWLVVRLPKKEARTVASNISKRQRKLISQPLARCSPLPVEWWNKRPKPVGKEQRALEILIGPAAYRGRKIRSSITSEKPTDPSERVPIMETDLSKKHIPRHSIVSESAGIKRPSSRPNSSNQENDN